MARFNVKDYGASGDGTGDDKLAIQAAIDAAHAVGGGTVYLPSGVYTVSGNSNAAHGSVRLHDNITMEGDGMGATTVKLMDGWDTKVTGIIRTFSGQVNQNITLRDLTIDGNRANNRSESDGFFTGVTPTDSRADQNIVVERVEVMNVSRYGFDPHEQTVGLVIRDSVAHHNGKDGFTIDYISFGTLENNISYANGRHGFNLVTSTHDMVVKNNIAYDNGGNGLVVQRGSDNRPLADNILIEGGKFYNNGLEGVLIKMSTDVTLRGAEIYNNGREGVEIDGSSGVLVTGNMIYNNSQVNPGGYDEVLISGYNDLSGPSGLYFSSNNNMIAGNIIYSVTGADYGVFEEEGVGNIVQGNSFFGSLKSAIKVVNATVSSNTDNVGTPYDISNLGALTDDLLIGGVASDTLYGGLGNDTLDGASSSDLLYGGNGNDSLRGQDGDDTLNAGAGADNINAGNGADSVLAGDGNDTVSGGAGRNQIFGEAGNDSVTGGINEDLIDGGDGNDILSASGGSDTLLGGMGLDSLLGGDGDDSLAGGGGDDRLNGNAGADIFVFATSGGRDTIRDWQDGIDKIDLTAFTLPDISTLGIVQQSGSVVITVDATTSIQISNALVANFTADDFLL